MKKLAYSFLLAALLLAAVAGAALAQTPAPGDPIGACPTGFHLHMMDDGHGGGEHMHVGLEADANGDNWICVKHISRDESIHVHVDNYLPLP